MLRFNSFNRTLTLTCLFLIAQSAWIMPANAESDGYTHYISDSMQIPLRRGAGTEFRIERMLSAGSQIKVLEVGDSNWSRIEFTQNNRTWEGWVNKVAIQSERPSKMLLEEQTERFNRLDTRFKQLQTEHTSLRDQFKTASTELEQIKQERFELNKQLEHIKRVAGSTLEIEQQNQDMRKLVGDLETQNVIMREQIAQAEDTVKRQWFLTGAGVLILGLLIGRFFRMPARRGGWDKI